MNQFRRSLKAVISQRLRIIRGHPSQEMVEYRSWILRLMCSSGPKAELKRLLLNTCANGDWTNASEVQLIIPPGPSYNEVSVRQQVTHSRLAALAGRLFRLYPRHRWLGAKAAVEDIALLEACHSLARATFQHMLAGIGPSSAPTAIYPSEQHGDAGHVETVEPGHLDHTTAEEHPTVGDRTLLPDLPTGEAAADEPVDPNSYALLNSRRKATATSWLEGSRCPLAHLLSLRLCLGPLCGLLETYLTRAGQKWDFQQRFGAQGTTAPGTEASTSASSPLEEKMSQSAESTFFSSAE